MAEVPPVDAGPVRELRIALVCYGGVSLAVYMHGTTKEIHQLVRASAAYEADQVTNPFVASGRPTEAAYWEVLKKLHEREKVRTRVVVDVITGTSAGGINGVCLATALARNTSQDPLRELWMKEGDIARLWRSGLSGKLWWKLRALGWGIGALLNPTGAKPPLRGDRMGRVLYDLLADLTGGEATTLVPAGQSLELFVTMTDLRGYRRFIRIKDRVIDDTTHRVVMRFRYDGSGADLAGADGAGPRDDFTAAQAGALSFAARATSSFPGAFPPVGLPSFDKDLSKRSKRRKLNPAVVAGFLPAYRPPFDTVERAWFVDGGVLDNKPFEHAVGAIVAKPASTEVRRWLVYLEPDPPSAPSSAGQQRSADEPGLLQTVIPALSGIPRSEPILDELRRLRQFNERIGDVRRLIAPQIENLPTVLEPLSALLDADSPPGPEQMASAMQEVHEQARRGVGTTYPTYLRLKLRSIHHALADAVAAAHDYPPESAQAALIRAVLGEWQDSRYGEDPTSSDAYDYIRSTDVPYVVRRLRFVVQGVSELYPAADAGRRQQLDTAKHQLYQFIDDIGGALAPARIRDVLGEASPFAGEAMAALLAGEPDPRQVAIDRSVQVSAMMVALGNYLDERLRTVNRELLAHFNKISGAWEPKLRRALLLRFLGFPLWDTAIFPLMSISEIQQFGPIQVARFSPDGAKRLSEQGRDKLQGVGVHHFGAFFSRAARECDYLWGRLDGAEQLLGLLDPDGSLDAAELYAAILDEEAQYLPAARTLMTECRAKLSR